MALWKGKGVSGAHSASDFLSLCDENVRIILALVVGGDDVMNRRQSQDLAAKLGNIVHSVQELVVHCAVSGPAMANLYRVLEKARVLVRRCCTEDWITEAVFQIENARDFQVILLEAGLGYHVIYEQAMESMSGKSSFRHLAPGSLTFMPASVGDVLSDEDTLKRRLEGLVQTSPSHRLARYLLGTWECISHRPPTSEFDLSRLISLMKEIESPETWGKGDYLGHGSCGGVSSATWLGISCAKKVFDGEVSESLFLKEAGILLHLNHPNVVKFFCCDNGQGEGACFIAMELMEMSLAKLISVQGKRRTPFSWTVAVDIIVQIARAMCYLHGMGVAHRDLKPQNVVVNKLASPHLEDQYCVKLVDFGMSKVKVEVSKSSVMTDPGIGTTKYRAPEVHPKAQPEGDGKVDWFKADVYSFGVTCAHLLSLKEPFEKMNLGNMYAELMNGLRPEVPATCPAKLVALLNDCWSSCRGSRPRFTEIYVRLEEIRHELLRGVPPPDAGFKEFIRIQVLSGTASEPPVDSVIRKSRGERAKHPDLLLLDPPSRNFRGTRAGEPLPSIIEPASTTASSVQNEAMSNFSEAHDAVMEFSKAQEDRVVSLHPLERVQPGSSSSPRSWYRKMKSFTGKGMRKKKVVDASEVALPVDYPRREHGEERYVPEGGDSPELRKLVQETAHSRAAGSQSDRSNWASREKLRIRAQSKSLRLESFREEEFRSLLWAHVD